MTRWHTTSRLETDSMEGYAAFSLTAAFLMLWYIAGLFNGSSHSKFLDYGAYLALFSAGPIVACIAAQRIERISAWSPERMRLAVALQCALVLLVLALVWLPVEVLKRIWYLPAGVHMVSLIVLLLPRRMPDDGLGLSGRIAEWTCRILLPLLPALLLIDVLAFSPETRAGLVHFSQSRIFLVGLAAGSVGAVAALFWLRRSSPAPIPQRFFSNGTGAAAIVAGIAVLLLTNTRLNFDWIHYGTYLGAANAVVQGRFPMVDTLSQYGILNYLLYSVAFSIAPHPSMTLAAAVSIVTNVATYACILVLAWQLCRVTWFGIAFGILTIYVANHYAPFALSSYPNFGGMRFFPAALVAVSLVALPAGRTFSPLSTAAFCIGLLWNLEGAACAIGAYAAYLIFLDLSGPQRLRALAVLGLLALATYGTFSLIALGATGSLPRFDLYLSLIFGFVSTGAYSGAQWLTAMDPNELMWVPLVLLYFGVLAVGWRATADRAFAQRIQTDRLFIAKVAAVAACGVILLSLFVFRSLMDYLLIAAPLGLTLFFALTAAVWSSASGSWLARTALGLPFVMIVGLCTAVLANILLEQDPAKTIAHDVSAAHDWVRIGKPGFNIALRRLRSGSSDDEISMSFPWKPARLRESITFVERWFAGKRDVLIFMPEAASTLMKSRKAHRFPTAYSVSELGSSAVSRHIVMADVALIEGETMVIANHPSELDTLETRIVRRILADWDARPIEVGQFATVYRLAKKTLPAPADRLVLPLPIAAAAASSAMAPRYSAASAADSWEATYWSTPTGAAPSAAWIQLDLGENRTLNRIELVPCWGRIDAFPSRFSVLVSTDGAAWVKVASEEKFTGDWIGYQSRSLSGYRIELPSRTVRWIRVEAEVPYSKSLGAHVLQIADVLAFGR